MAAIIWASGDIAGDSSVSTTGTSVFALSGSDVSTLGPTVNGVSFLQSTRADAAELAQSQSLGNESINVSGLGNDNAGSFQNGGFGVGGIVT